MSRSCGCGNPVSEPDGREPATSVGFCGMTGTAVGIALMTSDAKPFRMFVAWGTLLKTAPGAGRSLTTALGSAVTNEMALATTLPRALGFKISRMPVPSASTTSVGTGGVPVGTAVAGGLGIRSMRPDGSALTISDGKALSRFVAVIAFKTWL